MHRGGMHGASLPAGRDDELFYLKCGQDHREREEVPHHQTQSDGEQPAHMRLSPSRQFVRQAWAGNALASARCRASCFRPRSPQTCACRHSVLSEWIGSSFVANTADTAQAGHDLRQFRLAVVLHRAEAADGGVELPGHPHDSAARAADGDLGRFAL